MKRYKLLKDLPTFKAGDLFYISKFGDLIHDGGDFGVTAYARQTLDMFPNILTEWFEEIQEESIDSIHWKPRDGEKIWYLNEHGDVNFTFFNASDSYNLKCLSFGNIYRTSGECEKARNRRLTEARLRRTSKFKPDFENDKGGWIVVYNYRQHKLFAQYVNFEDAGEPVRYETEEDAQRSIEENREDWLIYFGVKEGK